MNEEAIAEQQRANLPQPTEHTPAVDAPPEATGFIDGGLDELTQYKLHDFFGENPKRSDYDTKQHLGFIYQEVSKMIDSTDFIDITNKMSEIMQIAGLNHSDRRIYKLSEWLKLRSVASNAHKKMETLRYG